MSKVEARCSHYIGKCGGEPVEGSVLCADEIGKISPSQHAQISACSAYFCGVVI